MPSRGVKRAGVAAGVLGLVLSLVAACGGARSADPGGDPTGPATSATEPAASPSSSSSGSIVPVADPAHAVPLPGPRSGELHSADLLVWSRRSLDDATIDRIRHTEGVTGVEAISMAQVSVEDRLLRVVAVDPATYRNFTPLESADAQAAWDRVAGGELAVDVTKRKQVRPDSKGYLTMGSEKDAPRVHIGAYVQQVPGLEDALVVNEKWGAAMGLAPHNALIVSTSLTAPDRVVKPVTRIVGKSVSVQRLDVVQRFGLDPKATQQAYVVGSVADAVGHYTYRVLGGGRIAPDPAWVAAHITTEQVPILGAVTCNRMMFPQLRAALQEVQDQGLAHTIHVYSGCYNPRFIAGTSTLSNHAFGLAIDIDAMQNQRGTAGHMNPEVVRIFEKWGFTWGGTWHYTDPMHFEINRIVHPG